MASDSQPPVETATDHCTDPVAFLRILHEPDAAFEVRILNCPERVGGSFASTAAGWFVDTDKAAKDVQRIEKLKPPAIYVTINPCKSVLMGRAMSRIKPKAKSTTADGDILRRRWLFIDIDAKRPAGVSSTDAELGEADAVSDVIVAAMRAAGWPDPLIGMSGNGRYLLWRIDLPNDDESTAVIKSVLQTLAQRFDTGGAEVDCSTFNAGRICKLLGTVARKGDELVGLAGIDDRPHRRSWFIPPASPLDVVSTEQLKRLAEQYVEPEQTKVHAAHDALANSRCDVSERASRYLAKCDPAIAGQHGHNRLLTAAIALVQGFDLPADEAMRLLSAEYNPRCEPAWSARELRHKVDEAMRLPGERGRLLHANGDRLLSVPAPSDLPGQSGASGDSIAIGDAWDDPLPIPDPMPSVMPYRSDLLPDAVGDAVDDIAERMQCPADFPAAAMLVAMAAVVGCRVGIRPRRFDDWLVVPNLWGCVVGRPSLKKSPAIAHAEKRVRAIESRDAERLAHEIESVGINALVAGSKVKALKSRLDKAMKTGDEMEARKLAEEIHSIENEVVPVSRRIITSDPTIEKLVEMLNVHRAGMLLWVDELVGWMRGLDRENQAGVRQQFLTLWNGTGRLNVDRVMRGEMVCDSPCVSLFGCATPGGLSAYVEAAHRGGRGDDGLIQRLQVLVWPDSPREFIQVDRWPNAEARESLAEVFNSLADIAPEQFSERDAFDDGAGIPWVRFDPNGQAIFDQWEITIQRRLRAGELPESIESHLSKYASLVPSIALVLHLSMGGRGAVGGDAAAMAVRWAQYLESHAGRVYAVATSPERQAAGPLLKRLIDWPANKPIRERTIRKNGWAHLTDKESIKSAFDLLADLGWVRGINVKPESGRPTTEYRLHPQAEKFIKAPGESAPKNPETPSVETFGGFGGEPTGVLTKRTSTSGERRRGVI